MPAMRHSYGTSVAGYSKTDENGNKFIDVNNAEDVYVADVNGDGIINVVDATLIQKYIARLVESL